MRAVIGENYCSDDRARNALRAYRASLPLFKWRLAKSAIRSKTSLASIRKYAVYLSIAKSDPLVTKRANQCVAIRPSIAVVDVWERPGHPQTPPDEQEARAHPQQYYEHQRPHESLPCDEDTTCDQARLSMRFAQNSPAISGTPNPNRTVNGADVAARTSPCRTRLVFVYVADELTSRSPRSL